MTGTQGGKDQTVVDLGEAEVTTVLVLPTLQLGAQIPAPGLLREVWQGIPGVNVRDLTGHPAYPNQPTSSDYVIDYSESPTDVLDEYGQRMHGYLVAPQTGSHTFWIASDDGGTLYLSTDEKPVNARQIASVASWTPSREWNWEPNQQSAPISLTAGKTYYVSALMKEEGGGDNLAVRWRMPDGADQAPIVATNLLPYGISFAAPSITRHPANTSAVEGATARFDVELSAVGIYTYQWQWDAVVLPGATASELVYGPVRLTDQGALLRVVVANDLGSATSHEAVLSVTPDTTRPRLLGAQHLGTTQLALTFSEPLSAASATRALN